MPTGVSVVTMNVRRCVQHQKVIAAGREGGGEGKGEEGGREERGREGGGEGKGEEGGRREERGGREERGRGRREKGERMEDSEEKERESRVSFPYEVVVHPLTLGPFPLSQPWGCPSGHSCLESLFLPADQT